MALEQRNGNYYYYKKEREGNRVVSKYYGKGELAALIAEMDEIERYEKAEKLESVRKNRQEQAEIDGKLNDIELQTKDLINEFLTSKGFYKTQSREWRYKNDK